MCKYKAEGICSASDEMCNEISPAACVYIIEAYEKGYDQGYIAYKEEHNKKIRNDKI